MPTCSAAAPGRWTRRSPSSSIRSAGSIRPTSIKLSTVVELPFGPGRRWLQQRRRQPHPRWMADRRGSELQQRAADRRHDGRCAAGDLQRHEPSERDGRRLACADRRRRVRSAGRSIPQSRGVLSPGRAVGQRASHQRRRAETMEHDREHEHREDDLDDESAADGRADGSVQSLRIASSGALRRIPISTTRTLV